MGLWQDVIRRASDRRGANGAAEQLLLSERSSRRRVLARSTGPLLCLTEESVFLGLEECGMSFARNASASRNREARAPPAREMGIHNSGDRGRARCGRPLRRVRPNYRHNRFARLIRTDPQRRKNLRNPGFHSSRKDQRQDRRSPMSERGSPQRRRLLRRAQALSPSRRLLPLDRFPKLAPIRQRDAQAGEFGFCRRVGDEAAVAVAELGRVGDRFQLGIVDA